MPGIFKYRKFPNKTFSSTCLTCLTTNIGKQVFTGQNRKFNANLIENSVMFKNALKM